MNDVVVVFELLPCFQSVRLVELYVSVGLVDLFDLFGGLGV